MPVNVSKFCCLVVFLGLLNASSVLAGAENNYSARGDNSIAAGFQPLQKIDYREKILGLFGFIDQFELQFRNLKYLNIFGQMPEVRTKFSIATAQYKAIKPCLPEELKILAQLYAAKFQLFDGMNGIMKNLRIDSGFRAALIRSGMVVLSYYNQIIDQFRVAKYYNKADLEQLEMQIFNISKKSQKYSITSKYLKLGGQKIPTNEKFMVLGIKDKKALVLYMGPTMTNDQIEGLVSLRDLEKRTSWQRENMRFFSEVDQSPK